MRRVWGLTAFAAAIFAHPAGGDAAMRNEGAARAGKVTAVSVLPGEGRAEVVVGLDGNVDVHDFVLSAPHRIVIDVSPATLGFTPKVYDGIARGGIVNVRVAQFRPDVVRIVLDADGALPYEIVRGGTDVRVRLPSTATFTAWSVGPQPATRAAEVTSRPAATTLAAPRPAALAGAAREPLQQVQDRITVTFRDMDLRDVIAVFAATSGRTIIPGSGPAFNNVRITVEVNNQPWDVALNGILAAQGMAAIEDPVGSGIIVIDTRANLQARRASEPLATERLALNYARATDLAPTLQLLLYRECGGTLEVIGGGGGGAAAAGGGDAAGGAAGGPPAQAGAQLLQAPPPAQCAPRGSVVPEATSNSLIITEAASRLESLLDYARSFDFRPPQVNISAKIIAVNRTNAEQLGVQYDIGTSATFFNTVLPRVSQSGQQTEAQVTLGGDALAAVANAGMTFENPSALNLIYTWAIGGFSFTSLLEALAQESLSEVHAQPSVNTMDKREARIFVGNDISYLLTPPTAAGAIQSQPPVIQTLEAGINLVVTPSISANRTVRLSVDVEQSSLVGITAAGPQVSRRSVVNEVLVNDGETLVIGGLTQIEKVNSRRGIPFLSTLPMIGRIFSSNESIERKADLLVLITPHILDDPVPGTPGRN